MLRVFHFVGYRQRQTITEPHRFEGIEIWSRSGLQQFPYPTLGIDPSAAACQWGVQQDQQVASSPSLGQFPVFTTLLRDPVPRCDARARIGINIQSGLVFGRRRIP